MVARGKEEGMGIKARKMAEGRCVKTIVLIFPNLFAIEEATSIDAAAMMLVVKKREPSIPSLRSNFFLKNQITQELLVVTNC